MSNNGSVAPKERVNIVYRPATGDAQSEVELPLKLLTMGDYTLRADDTPLEDMKPTEVDKDNFNDVMKAHNLTLTLAVPNQLEANADEDSQLNATIAFHSINDFTPDAIVSQVPELQQLIALRDALKSLKGPLGNIADFRKQLQALIQDDTVRARLLGELGIGNQQN